MTDLFVIRLCLFYAAQFVVIGIQMPFFPIWLADRGLDARAIGVLLAAPMIVRVPIVPIATRLADRFAAVRGAIVAALATALTGYLLASAAGGFFALFATVLLALIAFGMTFPLGDAYALRGLGERGRPYGSVRLWGSIAYIAANVGGGLLAGMMKPGDLIWLIIAACAITLVAAIGLPARTVDLSRPGEPAASHAKLWRAPAFVLAIAGASLIQASHALYYGFSTLDWAAKGLAQTTIGLLWGLAVVCEIVLFAFAARLPVAIGAVELIGIGALGAVIRWTMMALDPSPLTLPFLQGLHALSFGATYLGTMQLLTRIVPPRMAATAQGDLSAVQGIVMASATGLSGWLYAAYGDLAYMAMAAAAGAGGVLVIALALMTRGD